MYIDEFKFYINKCTILILPAQTCMRTHLCRKREKERERNEETKGFQQ